MTQAPESPAHLARVLGRGDLVLLFVVAITNLNIVPVVAASGPIALWLWVAALAFFFLPQGVAVIELAQRHPGEGGLYLWTKAEMGDLHGFVAGWCYWTNNVFYVPTVLFYVVGVSAFALGDPSLSDDPTYTIVVSLGLLWLMAVLNVIGLGVGKWLSNLGGLGTAATAATLVGLGLLAGRPPEDFLARFARFEPDFTLLSSFGVICFALVGLELASVMGDEIQEPLKTLPGAVVLGGVASGVLYLAATVAVLLALPEHEIGVVQGVLQAATVLADRAGLPLVVKPLAVVLTISLAGIASAWFAGSARIPFVAGLDHYLPEGLGRLHPRFGTPYRALAVAALGSSAMVLLALLGSGVREAYVTLLDLAVILQLVPFLYVYWILIRLSAPSAVEPVAFSRRTLRAAGIAGFITTALGMGLAFVPSRHVDSVLQFELKLLGGTALFLGAALFFHWRATRRGAARG